MKNKNIFFIIIILAMIAAAIGLGLSLGDEAEENLSPGQVSAVVSMIDGQQVIDITAKGGYSPRYINAQANLDTILRVSTDGTFDCSSALVIPQLNYQKFLEPTGVEEIAISADQAQGILQGLCSMGMYNFKINFN